MSKVVVLLHLTLDGVMQGPGRPDEDRRGGFEHGGWASVRGAQVDIGAEGLASTGALLFGRRTYEDFYSFWPKQGDNPFTALLDNLPKFVAATTLDEPLPWRNSILLKGNVAQAVARLKEQADKDLLIMGSGELILSLLQHGLIDEFVLLIHPLVLGNGRRLFPDGSPTTELELTSSKALPNGLIITHYRPVKTSDGR